MVTFGKSLQLCIDIDINKNHKTWIGIGISKNVLVSVSVRLKLPFIGFGKLSVGFTDTLYVLVYHYKLTT